MEDGREIFDDDMGGADVVPDSKGKGESSNTDNCYGLNMFFFSIQTSKKKIV